MDTVVPIEKSKSVKSVKVQGRLKFSRRLHRVDPFGRGCSVRAVKVKVITN